MKMMLTIISASLALSGFAQTESSHAVNILAPIPPEKVAEYDMQAVIYNEATRSDNNNIEKLMAEGWYIHSILPFGWRLGGAASAAYKEDLLIVYIRPRNVGPKKDEKTKNKPSSSKK